MPVPVGELEAWHHRPGALERLVPPWERVEVVSRRGDGPEGRVCLQVGRAPFRRRWVAEVRPLEGDRGFRDVQVEGPFVRWEHVHRFEPAGPDASTLVDRVEYALPLSLPGRMLLGRRVRRRVERMFRYRHRVTEEDLRAHAKAPEGERLWVAVTGGSGLVGTALTHFLVSGGHRVTHLVRHPPRMGADEVRWDPGAFVDTGSLEGVDAVVHLAGENIAGRWTEEKKAAIRDSRLEGTRVLARFLAEMDRPPRVLVSASAVGYYGDAGEERLEEDAPPGEGFLAGVCRGWERAAMEAAAGGVRVVRLRIGMVLSPEGGALRTMLPAFRLGLGGPLGDGRQWVSWISRDDLVGIIHHAILDESLSGPVNAVAPHPVRNRELASALGRVLSRPARLRAPASVLRLLAGEMGEELLLSSARAVPAALEAAGYRYRHAGLEEALRHLLGRG